MPLETQNSINQQNNSKEYIDSKNTQKLSTIPQDKNKELSRESQANFPAATADKIKQAVDANNTTELTKLFNTGLSKPISPNNIKNVISSISSLNNKPILTTKDIFLLSDTMKLSLATKLAQVAVAQENNLSKNKNTVEKDQNTIKQITTEIYNKLFSNPDQIPPMEKIRSSLTGSFRKEQETGNTNTNIEGSSASKDAIQKNGHLNGIKIGDTKIDMGERVSYESNDIMQRKKDQTELHIIPTAEGVDKEGAQYTIKIGKEIITGHTTGKNDKNIDPNIIIWDNIDKIPQGITIKNGGISIDQKYKGLPVAVNSKSIGYDVVTTTLITNGVPNIEEVYNANQQIEFKNNSHEINDANKSQLDSQISKIKDVIKNSGKEKVNIIINSTTDASIIDPKTNYLADFRNDIGSLQKELNNALSIKFMDITSQGKTGGKDLANELIRKIKTQYDGRETTKGVDLDKDANRELATCRALEGIIHLINMPGITKEDIQKMNFAINIKGNDTKRRFNFETDTVKYNKPANS